MWSGCVQGEQSQALARDPPGLQSSRNSTHPQFCSPQNPEMAQGQARDLCQGRPSLQQSTVCAPCLVLHTTHPAKPPPFCTLKGPTSTYQAPAPTGSQGASWAHLHVAEVVSCIAAVPRVHQHCIEAIGDGIALGLGHVRPDVQELRVSHVLCKENVSGDGMAFLSEQEQLCCAMSPIS